MFEGFSLTLDPQRVRDYAPWYYPIVVNDEPVRLGDGSQSSHDYLKQWQNYRDGVLGDELLAQLDFRGRSLRDYACNCGYWGLKAAARGLASYIGIEGRQVFIDQARQLWSQNLAQSCDYRFVQGNVASADMSHSQVDISFCLGILYHLPDWKGFLRRVMATTAETIVVETRIHPAHTQPYPGDLDFNRIAEVGFEGINTPSLAEIYLVLAEKDWVDVRMLLNRNSPGHLVPDGELFNRGNTGRVALIARRLS